MRVVLARIIVTVSAAPIMAAVIATCFFAIISSSNALADGNSYAGCMKACDVRATEGKIWGDQGNVRCRMHCGEVEDRNRRQKK